MRVYGRVPIDKTDPKGPKKWVVVQTDNNNFNDAVYVTALAQTLLLNLNESPFWGNYGIPAKASVIQQIAPDLYVTFIQRYYTPFFASLVISKQADVTPTYKINIITKLGAKINRTLPVPI